jgi:hypothetical protein
MKMKDVWQKLKENVWRIAFLVVALCLLTSHVSFQYAARYVAGDTASDGERVAKFEFLLTSDLTADTQLLVVEDMKPGDEQSYKVVLQNAGEVALLCKVVPKNLTGNLPLKMETVSASVNVGGSVEVTFKIEWPSTENSPEFMGQVDVVELTVSVEQID